MKRMWGKKTNRQCTFGSILTMMAPTRARQPPRMLRLMLTNAFGILSKLGEFQASLNAHHPDIVIVTETKVTEDKATPADLTFPGYFPPVRRDRTAQGGGAVLLSGFGPTWLSQN